MEKENAGETDQRKLKFKRDIQVSWTFIAAAAIFLVLTFLPNVSNNLLGISYLLLAGTVTYTTFKSEKILRKEGKSYLGCTLMIYGAGILSALWIFKAIELLF